MEDDLLHFHHLRLIGKTSCLPIIVCSLRLAFFHCPIFLLAKNSQHGSCNLQWWIFFNVCFMEFNPSPYFPYEILPVQCGNDGVYVLGSFPLMEQLPLFFLSTWYWTLKRLRMSIMVTDDKTCFNIRKTHDLSHILSTQALRSRQSIRTS